jgi:hypothetical protein
MSALPTVLSQPVFQLRHQVRALMEDGDDERRPIAPGQQKI